VFDPDGQVATYETTDSQVQFMPDTLQSGHHYIVFIQKFVGQNFTPYRPGVIEMPVSEAGYLSNIFTP
jgi:hypothetical protein